MAKKQLTKQGQTSDGGCDGFDERVAIDALPRWANADDVVQLDGNRDASVLRAREVGTEVGPCGAVNEDHVLGVAETAGVADDGRGRVGLLNETKRDKASERLPPMSEHLVAVEYRCLQVGPLAKALPNGEAKKLIEVVRGSGLRLNLRPEAVRLVLRDGATGKGETE